MKFLHKYLDFALHKAFFFFTIYLVVSAALEYQKLKNNVLGENERMELHALLTWIQDEMNI
jgi:hypothetical protein